MILDRNLAHLADMLRFTQELRSLAVGHTQDSFTRQRILCLAVEKLFINLGEAAFAISRGDRIAQLVLAPVVRAAWNEVADLDDTARGAGGFGSTGGHAAL